MHIHTITGKAIHSIFYSIFHSCSVRLIRCDFIRALGEHKRLDFFFTPDLIVLVPCPHQGYQGEPHKDIMRTSEVQMYTHTQEVWRRLRFTSTRCLPAGDEEIQQCRQLKWSSRFKGLWWICSCLLCPPLAQEYVDYFQQWGNSSGVHVSKELTFYDIFIQFSTYAAVEGEQCK